MDDTDLGRHAFEFVAKDQGGGVGKVDVLERDGSRAGVGEHNPVPAPPQPVETLAGGASWRRMCMLARVVSQAAIIKLTAAAVRWPRFSF